MSIIMMVISMYLSCIMDVLKVVPHTHTLSITILGPTLSGHPDLGICSPWVWLLLGGGSHCMAAPDMLCDKACMFQHALVGC
jgi:hypothetical protein